MCLCLCVSVQRPEDGGRPEWSEGVRLQGILSQWRHACTYHHHQHNHNSADSSAEYYALTILIFLNVIFIESLWGKIITQAALSPRRMMCC